MTILSPEATVLQETCNLYRNELNELTEPFHHCEEIISFPSSSENESINYQLCAAVRQDAKGKCVLYFKFEDRFFQLNDCDKIKAALTIGA